MPSPGRELHHTEDKQPAKPEPAGLGEDEQIDVVARASVIHSEGAGHGHQPNEWEPGVEDGTSHGLARGGRRRKLRRLDHQWTTADPSWIACAIAPSSRSAKRALSKLRAWARIPPASHREAENRPTASRKLSGVGDS